MSKTALKTVSHSVTGKRLTLRSTILINLAAALIAQIVLAANIFPLFGRILRADLTSEGYHVLLAKAILIGCICTVIGIVATEQLLERSFLKPSQPWEFELSRAMYYSAIGILSIAIERAITDANMIFGWCSFALFLILLGFARYHARFKEARQGIWFPYLIFHAGIQIVVLFPLDLTVVKWTLIR